MLHKGPSALFSGIAYEYNVRDAIEAGYLCPPVSTASATQIDTTDVGIRGGEFIAGQLEAAAMDPDVVEAVADEIVRYGADRRGWAIFGCGIAHCTALRDAVRQRGYSCEGVFATTPKAERTAIIEAFRRQEIRALTSVNALTVGFNARHLDLVALARPTKSPGLYVQAIGRGLRTFPGKENALILDMGGNIARFGPVDAIRIKDKTLSDGTGEMPTKVCPECEAPNQLSALECVECGAAFPPMVSKVELKPSKLAVLSSQIQPEWVDVTERHLPTPREAGQHTIAASRLPVRPEAALGLVVSSSTPGSRGRSSFSGGSAMRRACACRTALMRR
jgi:DNA repair protein RadD